MSKFGTKNARFWYFWREMRYLVKSYSHIWNQHLPIFLIPNFVKKQKGLNYRPKMPYLSIFDQKSCLWEIFGWNLKTKFCLIRNQHLWICLIAKFCRKSRMFKFGSKNVLFQYFPPKIVYFGIFGEEFWRNYCQISNQHLQICLFVKFHKKTTMPKFETKKTWFMYFCAGIWEQYSHIWNQHPPICLIAKLCEKNKNACISE